MRDMIEMAIERETELLDATLEFPEILELPVFPWRNIPSLQKFSARGASRRSYTARPGTRRSYAN